MVKKIKKVTLGYSTLSGYRKCPTYFKYRYLQQLSRIQGPITQTPAKKLRGSALTFGQVLHDFLEDYHAGVLPDDELLKKHDKAAKEQLPDIPDKNDRSAAQAAKIYRAYISHYRDVRSAFRPIKVGGELALELEHDELVHPQINWRLHFDGLVEVTEDIPELGLKKGESAPS